MHHFRLISLGFRTPHWPEHFPDRGREGGREREEGREEGGGEREGRHGKKGACTRAGPRGRDVV